MFESFKVDRNNKNIIFRLRNGKLVISLLWGTPEAHNVVK